MYFYVPETKGLPEAEKKKLFYPGAKWGRKLREGEESMLQQKTPYQVVSENDQQKLWNEVKVDIG